MRAIDGEFRFGDRVALVTGGGKGVGRALALALAARGVKVVVMGREERALGEAVGEMAYGGGKARHVVGDVRNPAHVEAAVSRAIDVFGGLDLVVGNARARGRIELGTEPAEVEAILATNVLGMHHTLRAGAARMNDGGRLVAVGSTCPVSAAALGGLVEATAVALASRRITGNAVIPRGTWGPDADPARIVEAAIAFLSADAPSGRVHHVDAG